MCVKQNWLIWRASNKNKWSKNFDKKVALQSCQHSTFHIINIINMNHWWYDKLLRCSYN